MLFTLLALLAMSAKRTHVPDTQLAGVASTR